MPGEIVLITGVSGHVGFRVLVEALVNGYKARAVVRKELQITHIKNIKSIQPYVDNLEFALVPDFTAPGAFDAHVVGASYIIHVAAPQFSSVDALVDVAEFAATSRAMTKNILEASSKAPSVKRVVITSSISALLTSETMQGDSDLVYNFFSAYFMLLLGKSPISTAFTSPIPEKAPGIIAYVISKVLAALDVDKYVQEKNPSYSVASIFIGTVFGRNDLAKSTQDLLKGSNLLALASLLGLTFPPTPSLYIHLDDAALSHIRALTIDIAPSTTRNLVVSYNTVANPDSVRWDEALDVVKKALPGAVASGVFPLGGTLPTLKALVDSTEEERILGSKFKPLGEAVVEVASQFLELAQASQT